MLGLYREDLPEAAQHLPNKKSQEKLHDFKAVFREDLICLICLKDYIPTDICYRAVAGIPVKLSEQPISISLVDVAVCEIEEQTDNNVQMEKVKLTFSTLRELPTRQNIAFVIRTVDGSKFIIGSKERPYPTVRSAFGRLQQARRSRQPQASPTATLPSESTRFPIRQGKHSQL